jgi:hypothetical protein
MAPGTLSSSIWDFAPVRIRSTAWSRACWTSWVFCDCTPDGLDLALDAVWETPPERCGVCGSLVGALVVMAKGEVNEGIGD